MPWKVQGEGLPNFCCRCPHSPYISWGYNKSWYCAGMRPTSSVTIFMLTMSVSILVCLVYIVVCFGRVEMRRGPVLARSDGWLQQTTPIVQFLTACLGEPVAVSQAQSLCHASATTTTAAPARAFSILGSLSHSIMVSSDAPSNPWDWPIHMVNALTTY